jgi:hypothetical protein
MERTRRWASSDPERRIDGPVFRRSLPEPSTPRRISLVGEVRQSTELTQWILANHERYESKIGMVLYPAAHTVIVPGEFVLIVPDQPLDPALFLGPGVARRLPCLLNGIESVILRTTAVEGVGKTAFEIVSSQFAIEPAQGANVVVEFPMVRG